MSGYINFYLIPKGKKVVYDPDGNEMEKEIEQIPLLLVSYSRSSDVYRYFHDAISPPYFYSVDEDGNMPYMELTVQGANEVVGHVEKLLNDAKASLEVDYKILSKLNKESFSELYSEVHSSEGYIRELEDTLHELKFIKGLVREIEYGWSDYEKIVINNT